MFWVPAKLELKVIARLSVRVLPLSDALLAAGLSEHWLFCNVRGLPSSVPFEDVAASFSR